MSKILSAAQGATSLDPQVTENAVASREALRRSLEEVGYHLRPEPESFDNGGALTTALDVLLDEASGKAYSGSGPYPQTVGAGTSPSSGGFTDRSGVLSLNRVFGPQSGRWEYSAVHGTTLTSKINTAYCNISGKNFGVYSINGGVDLLDTTGDFTTLRDFCLNGTGANRGVFSAGTTRWAVLDSVTLSGFAKAVDLNSLQYSTFRNLRLFNNDTAISFGGAANGWSGAASFYHTHISATNGVGVNITTNSTTVLTFNDTIIEGTNKAIQTKGAVQFNRLYVGDQNNTVRPEVPSAIDSDGARILINAGELGITSFQTANRKTVFDIKNAGKIVVNDSSVGFSTQRNSSNQFFPVDLVSFDSTDCVLELNNVRFGKPVNMVHSLAPFKLTGRTILHSRTNIKNYVIDGTFQPGGYISALTTGTLLPVNLGFVNQFGGGAVKLTRFTYDFTYDVPLSCVGKKMCLEIWFLKGINNNGRYVDFANSDFVEKPAITHFYGMGGGYELDQPTPNRYVVTPTKTRGIIRVFTNDSATPPSEVYMTSVILKSRAFEDCLDFVEDVKSALV